MKDQLSQGPSLIFLTCCIIAETYAVKEHNYLDVIAMMLMLFRHAELCTNRSIFAHGHAYYKRDGVAITG
jgi:hypothetical protein